MRAAVARLDGLGALDALLHDDDVDEVLVNAGGDVWVERDGTTRPRRARSPPADLAVVIERILAPLGRRLDRTNPVVDARLADGSRVCAVIPPVALDGAMPRRCVAFATAPCRSTAFADADVADAPRRAPRSAMQRARLRRDVVGQDVAPQHDARPDRPGRADRRHRGHRRAAPGATTTSCAWRPGRPHRTDCRRSRSNSSCAPPCACDPTGSSSARCAAPRSLGLVQALNTGHDGSWSTCHANSALDALHRLETLVIQAAPAWPLLAVRQQLTRSIDAVVHVARTGKAARRVVEIGEVVEAGDSLQLQPLVDGRWRHPAPDAE